MYCYSEAIPAFTKLEILSVELALKSSLQQVISHGGSGGRGLLSLTNNRICLLIVPEISVRYQALRVSKTSTPSPNRFPCYCCLPDGWLISQTPSLSTDSKWRERTSLAAISDKASLGLFSDPGNEFSLRLPDLLGRLPKAGFPFLWIIYGLDTAQDISLYRVWNLS